MIVELCRVCLRRPVTGGGVCDDCRSVWDGAAPTWGNRVRICGPASSLGQRTAVEAKVLTDVNATSGTQAQAYATSVLATLRKAITKLETAGYDPSAYVLHPTDWEGVELALSSQAAVEHLSIPYDAATRRLFGVPVTTSNAQTAGVGHVLASGAVALDTDTRGVDVQWSENADRGLVRQEPRVRPV